MTLLNICTIVLFSFLFLHIPFIQGENDEMPIASSENKLNSTHLTSLTPTISITKTITEKITTTTSTLTIPISPTTTISPTLTLRYSPTITPSISLTPTLEVIPDNMYTRAESCKLDIVSICEEIFCLCISRKSYPIRNNPSWETDSNMNRCTTTSNRNCYYNFYCARERVSCLWNASFHYMGALGFPGADHALDDEIDDPIYGEGVCAGLKSIQGNFTIITDNINYYDSVFYTECVDYVTYILKRTGGDLCVTSFVPMYACGPSLLPIPPARHINYKPIEKGSRRLVISIVARIVGNFSAIFGDEWDGNLNADNINTGNQHVATATTSSTPFIEQLHNIMYSCFYDAIGINGAFTMRYVDECIIINYDVGVGEADPWVGDLVTANALRLMVRNISWLERAQRLLDNSFHNHINLSAPIVVYDVIFEAGVGQPVAQLCEAACIVGITLATAMAAGVLAATALLCCRRSHALYVMFEAEVSDSDDNNNNNNNSSSITRARRVKERSVGGAI